MTPRVLELTGVTKAFGAARALRGVSFSLRAGEVHALVGENGAGKSTLIKIITGAHRPDAGEIRIDGQVMQHLTPAIARASGIAAIYQQPSLFPDLSVLENIALGLETPSPMRRIRWTARRQRAIALLKRVGADIDPDTEVRNLSMPQQQLVEIARALGAGARILIMDEPTASLNSREVDLLLDVVRDLCSQGVAIIYITHRLAEVFPIANRVTVLRDGETVAERDLGDNSAPGVTESELIRLMVGREVSAVFPAAENHAGETVLELRGVSCRAGGIRDASLQVRAGEILGVAGLMGAGRTELARVIFGITPADGGTITLAGNLVRVDSPQAAVAAGIGYVPEDRRRHGVIMEMSIAANVSLAIHRQLFPGTWLRFDTERTLAQNYLRDLSIKAPSPETTASELSGGNQQKVALARWLASKPRLLILDEPTQGVDVGAKAEIYKLIRTLAAGGLAIMMISSELLEILGMSDRIAVMRGGTVTAILDRKDADAHSVMTAAVQGGPA